MQPRCCLVWTTIVGLDAIQFLTEHLNIYTEYQYQLDTKPDVLLEIATANVDVTQEPVSLSSSHNPEPGSAGQLKPTTVDFLNECHR